MPVLQMHKAVKEVSAIDVAAVYVNTTLTLNVGTLEIFPVRVGQDSSVCIAAFLCASS